MLLVISSKTTGVVFLWLSWTKLSQNAAMVTRQLGNSFTLILFQQYQSRSWLNSPVMLPVSAPCSFCAWVMKSMSPSSSTAGPVQQTGIAKLILTAWILQATTPNQWQAAEQKAWCRRQETPGRFYASLEHTGVHLLFLCGCFLTCKKSNTSPICSTSQSWSFRLKSDQTIEFSITP